MTNFWNIFCFGGVNLLWHSFTFTWLIIILKKVVELQWSQLLPGKCDHFFPNSLINLMSRTSLLSFVGYYHVFKSSLILWSNIFKTNIVRWEGLKASCDWQLMGCLTIQLLFHLTEVRVRSSLLPSDCKLWSCPVFSADDYFHHSRSESKTY